MSNTSLLPEEFSEEYRREVLEERARNLAKAQVAADFVGNTLEVLEFTIGTEHYALEIGYLKEVTRIRDLALLPCTRPALMGLMNFRGQILPVLNIAELVEVERTSEYSVHEKKVLVLQMTGALAGIAADEIIGITAIANNTLQRPELVCSSARAAVLKGIRVDKLALIDVERILKDPRILVDETA